MGFFTKDAVSGPSAAPAPLTKERVKAALEAEGWSYNVDSDGDIGGGWEFGSYYFFVNGKSDELLCVRGFWRATLDMSDWGRALEVVNSWNDTKRWPKAYAHRMDDGRVRMLAEHNVDYEHGLTDQQLRQHLLCVINTAESFFEHLTTEFPEAWEQVRPQG